MKPRVPFIDDSDDSDDLELEDENIANFDSYYAEADATDSDEFAAIMKELQKDGIDINALFDPSWKE